jgi:hypothetical protein
MAGNGPNGKNRRDGIDQGEKQAAVEGGRRPQRRRCPQPEGARKKRPVRHAHIAEKALDPIEESGQPFRIEPRREIAPGEARAQLVIVLALQRSFRRCSLRQNAEIILIDERSDGNAEAVDQKDRRPQRPFRRESRQQGAERSERIADRLGRLARWLWITQLSAPTALQAEKIARFRYKGEGLSRRAIGFRTSFLALMLRRRRRVR